MKNRILFYLILLGIIAGCGSDEAPSIEVISSNLDQSFQKDDVVMLDLSLTDDNALAQVRFTLSKDIDETIDEQIINLSGQSETVSYQYQLIDDESDLLNLIVEVDDVSGLTSSVQYSIDYLGKTGGSLQLNIQLLYHDEPLVMLDEYQYPDGRTMNFTRFSMYLSDILLDDINLKDIDFINFSTFNADPVRANSGFDYLIENVPAGTYTDLSLGLGVSPDLNALVPGDFPAQHPLARQSEHWFSWQSYIFTKIEGQMDSDNSGEKDRAFALHLGADEAYRSISYDETITIEEGKTSTKEIKIDLYNLFKNGDVIYDIDNDFQIHSLTQLPSVLELSDNYVTCFK